MSAPFGSLLALVQALLGIRVAWRLWRSGAETPIGAAPTGAIPPGSVAIVVPALDEVCRLGRCLDGAIAQGPEVAEIVVVDSGSTDGTCDLVRRYTRRDRRIRLVEAGAAPDDWNGKVWGLHHGAHALGDSAEWVLTLDADVIAAPALARSLVSRARWRGLSMLSVATQQHVSGAVEAALHPAMLASLVYRFGRPNGATSTPEGALANGQCCLIRRDFLGRLGGFEAVRNSLCEDVTLARLAARAGESVGFYEAAGLIDVTMYFDWRDAWRNWPRSLATRDALFGIHGWLGLLEVLFTQSLPLPIMLLQPRGPLRLVNMWLAAMRIGVLVGIARAYPAPPRSFWLSPLADLPVALAVWRSALAPHHTWRGRTYIRKKGSIVAA